MAVPVPVDEFENDVKVNGTQTYFWLLSVSKLFENDVKVNGTQTETMTVHKALAFENDVKWY